MVALYGSAAVDDASEAYSDINLIVVSARLGVAELELLAPLCREWAATGNPPPLLFAHERLLNSSHVFPIELLDIKENHRVLFGRDVLKALPISQANLKFQLEHELKAKLIRLREDYLLSDGDRTAVLDLILRSLSGYQIMLKAALRFYEVNVPAKKRDAVVALARHVFFDMSVLVELQAIKDGERPAPSEDEGALLLFERFLDVVERCADLIGGIGRGRGQ